MKYFFIASLLLIVSVCVSAATVKGQDDSALQKLMVEATAMIGEKLVPTSDLLIRQLTDAVRSIASKPNVNDVVKDLRALDMTQIVNLQAASKSKPIGKKKPLPRFKDSAPLPVVQMHGMGDFSTDPGLVSLGDAISAELNGTYVLTMRIGDNVIEDILNGFIMNLDDQVEYFANVVRSDPQLEKGFNAVGYSQGNLVIRGYIERFNQPPVKNCISMHGPLAGVAAFPGCSLDHNLCRAFSEVLGALAYHPPVQKHLAQANYFRDPFKIDAYQKGAIFLPDLNNEDGSVDITYNQRFLSLDSLCLVKAMGDTVVIPNDSEWFGFYQDQSFDEIWAYNQTPWYTSDAFGLQSLDKARKVFFDTTDGNHLEFSTDYLMSLVDLYFK